MYQYNPPLEVSDFSGGFSDNYIDGALNTGQVVNNFYITKNRKLLTRPGRLIYNSTYYQIPAGTALGMAAVTITNGNGIGATGLIEIRTSAPSIFTANASGSGPAAAVDALTGAAAPFNAKRAGGEPNILSIFGTGLGGDATDVDGNVNAGTTARIDGNPVTLHYAGRAPGYVGLNQFNVELPADITAGVHTLTLTRGATSNTVTIAIR